MADYNITAVTRRVVYTGSAGVGPYAFTFPVISQTDIAVYKNSTKLTLTTNYTVTVSSANGTGSVTLVVAATGSDRITIIGARAIERTTDFVTAGDLKASSLNEQLDASIIMIQQLAEENKRTLKAPQFDPAAVEDSGTLNMVLPVSTSRAGKLLAFDTDGNPVVGEDIGNWRGNWAAGVAFVVRDLVKDGSNSNVYRVNTAHTSSGTTPISSNADVAKFDLVVDAAASAASAAAAASSASAASSSASASSSSASAASSSASAASSSASAASSSASNSSTSASAAAASAAAAAASFDAFDDIYLGAYSTNPTLDNDGNALTTGDQYFNTTANELRVWNGSSWQSASVIGGTVSTLNVTGVASFADGSAALPSITNDGDTNTGIFFPAADTIAFAEGGAEAMRINSSGNVGIGTTDTSLFNSAGGTTRLAVCGSSASTDILGNTAASISIINTDTTANNTAGLHFARADTDDTPNYAGASIVAQFPDTQVASQYPKGLLSFLTSTIANAAPSEKMRIDSSGNVGIGATPGTILDVYKASGNPYLRVYTGTGSVQAYVQAIDSSYVVMGSLSNHDLGLVTNGAEVARLTTAGLLKFNSGYGSVATAYGCRAWVNFNGTGTVAIRGSGNVSSITDNGTGDYTVNFTTAMPDANYYVNASTAINSTEVDIRLAAVNQNTAQSTSLVRVVTNETFSLRADRAFVYVTVVR